MVSLYDSQKKAVDLLRSGSILHGGVGTGKSRTSLAYFYTKVCGGKLSRLHGKGSSPIQYPVDLYIITTARKRDTFEWDEELVYFGMVRGENPELDINIFIDSWNNIPKYANVTNAFFIFDEQRLVGSGTWVKSFLKISKSNRWILLTATPGDTWLDYIPVFIANGFYRNRTEFLRRHVIFNRYVKYPKVDRYLDTKRLEKLKSAILVEMDSVKKATQHHSWVKVGYDELLYLETSKTLWDPFKNEPFQNKAALGYALRRISNDTDYRIDAIANILMNHWRAIVFYNFDYELEKLRDFCKRANYLYAEWNGHKHEAIPTGSAWLYLVQYTAGAEGWNCVQTDTIIFYSQTYSYKTLKQACGRIDRLNTPFADLFYYHIFSDAPIDKAIRECLKHKRDFNESYYFSSRENHRL